MPIINLLNLLAQWLEYLQSIQEVVVRFAGESYNKNNKKLWKLETIYWFAKGPKNFKNEKNDCAIFEFSRVTQIFKGKKGPTGPKMKIHSIYNCAKFQHDCAISDFSKLPQSFDSKLQQTNIKTDENEMPFPLYFPIILSCEAIKHHLTLTAFASDAILSKKL